MDEKSTSSTIRIISDVLLLFVPVLIRAIRRRKKKEDRSETDEPSPSGLEIHTLD